MAANTENFKEITGIFYKFTSLLEKDLSKPDEFGLVGLEKLNMANVTDMFRLFDSVIYKQKTLESLKDWKLGSQGAVDTGYLFYSENKDFDFSCLNGWFDSPKNPQKPFRCSSPRKQIFTTKE